MIKLWWYSYQTFHMQLVPNNSKAAHKLVERFVKVGKEKW